MHGLETLLKILGFTFKWKNILYILLTVLLKLKTDYKIKTNIVILNTSLENLNDIMSWIDNLALD